MKIIVCGGREYEDRERLFSILDRVLSKYGDSLVIIHGAARGADEMAEEWAKFREVEYMGFPAKWRRIGGKGAGAERNRRMRDKARPDACIAFPGGRGTAMMCKLMREIGIEPWVIV